MKHVADKEMIENALGEENYDEYAIPPFVKYDEGNLIALEIIKNLKDIFDPEIPVNIYELGLIYKIEVSDVANSDEKDVYVEMTLTSPNCPVAQEMPQWVQSAAFKVEGVRHADVDIVFDPPWTPSMMAETAKLQLNMFT